MSRNTVTLTAPNGAKVRTVRSKRFFVVRYGDLHVKFVPNEDPFIRGEHVRLDPPVPFAEVDKRTDSLEAALTALRKAGQAVIIRVMHDAEGELLITTLDRKDVEDRVAGLKQSQKFAARRGDNGDARRLAY